MTESNFLRVNTVADRELRTFLERLAICSCHIWLVVRIKCASLAAYLSLCQGLLVYPILLVILPPSRTNPGMPGELLTGMFNHNTTNQSK